MTIAVANAINPATVRRNSRRSRSRDELAPCTSAVCPVHEPHVAAVVRICCSVASRATCAGPNVVAMIFIAIKLSSPACERSAPCLSHHSRDAAP